jgi:hypothetical protein
MHLTQRHERLLVAFVALHSAVVGLLLILAPGLAAQLGGWERIDPAFFGRQAGVFHIVLAAGYLMVFARYRGVRLIVIAKSSAFVFLLAHTVLDPLPWAVPASGVIDGLMARVVWWVHRQVKPSPSAKA